MGVCDSPDGVEANPRRGMGFGPLELGLTCSNGDDRGEMLSCDPGPDAPEFRRLDI